jgi:hypothetical protein
MSARPRIPSYRLHRQSGQAVVTLTDAVTGQRKDRLLGKYNTPASKEEYRRVVLDALHRGSLEPRQRRLAEHAAVRAVGPEALFKVAAPRTDERQLS